MGLRWVYMCYVMCSVLGPSVGEMVRQPYGVTMCSSWCQTRCSACHCHYLSTQFKCTMLGDDASIQLAMLNWTQSAARRQVIVNQEDANVAEDVKFGETCNRHRVCSYTRGRCLDGTCSCTIGYSYNFTQHACVEKCDVYGNQFSRYAHSRVTGCRAEKGINFVSNAVKCMEQCKTKSTCVCVEYALSTCLVCEKTWTSLHPHGRQNGTVHWWGLYYRHCLEP